jgi:alkylhydroperoxidase/carboxymuconolactone decarboxylase family protein YurZ
VGTAEQRLRRLALGDTYAEAGCPLGLGGGSDAGLDARTQALIRLAAVVALGVSDASYERAGRQARAAGASADDVIDILVALGTTIGLARLVAATPGLSLAVGYDIEAAFEGREEWAREPR